MSETMSNMIAYSRALLMNISEWLSAEPMIYFVAALFMLFVINIILRLSLFARKG